MHAKGQQLPSYFVVAGHICLLSAVTLHFGRRIDARLGRHFFLEPIIFSSVVMCLTVTYTRFSVYIACPLFQLSLFGVGIHTPLSQMHHRTILFGGLCLYSGVWRGSTYSETVTCIVQCLF